MEFVDKPLTARSVLLSTLLGTEPPRLPVSFLVRTGELFNLSAGAVRTALSRMVAAGEVERDESGGYSLVGDLVSRQERQRRGRAAVTSAWNGRWLLAVVASGTRSAPDRASLRTAMTRLRFAELREGVWTRPDNLDSSVVDVDWSVVAAQCISFDATPRFDKSLDDAEFAAGLWDLRSWSDRATELRREMHRLLPALETRSHEVLPKGFVISAAVLRHFGADPLLPRELLPRSWPGYRLRSDYQHYDELYRDALGTWIGENLSTRET